jgi:hypothetical protein
VKINITFDQSTSSLPSGFVADINYVVNYFDNLFTNNITISIDVGYGEIDGQALASYALGESLPVYNGAAGTVGESYGSVRSALIAQGAPGSGTLPSNAPPGSLYMTQAEAKALGLLPNDGSLDGYVGFSSVANAFSYAANSTPPSYEYYFIGVVEHEFTEIMSRYSFVDYSNAYSVMDLFRWAAPGSRQFTTGGPSYFSVNGGNTNLDSWNNYQNGNTGGDLGDWAASAGNDALDAFGNAGVINVFSQSDITLMGALGWTTTASGITVSATVTDAVQGGAPVALPAHSPVITDTTSTLVGATIKIANGSGSAVAGDKLFVNGQQSGTVAGGAVAVSWNATTNMLTLSGAASLSSYQTLLGQVTYQDTGTDTSSGSHPVRAVTWTVNDGSQTLSTISQVTIDRPPVANNAAGFDVIGTTLSVSAANGVISHDSDLDGDTLTVSTVNGVAANVGMSIAGTYGHLTLNANGSYSYVANPGAAAGSVDSFTYRPATAKAAARPRTCPSRLTTRCRLLRWRC